MNNYLVSVCVPVYNVSKYIERCVDSILNQTYRNLEIIFVDDCSPDDSILKIEAVLSKYHDRQKQVHIIRHTKNLGLAATRNTGVENTHGEFIVHVDSDDWLELDAIENLVKRQLETNADIVSGRAIAHYSNGQIVLQDIEFRSKEEIIHSMIELTINHAIWRRLIRKSLYIDNNIKAEEGYNIGEDHYTIPRLFYYSRVVANLDKIVYNYNCMNEDSYLHPKSIDERLKRYRSDSFSIDYLIDFFYDKDKYCLKRLKEIKATHTFDFTQYCYSIKDKYNYNIEIIKLFDMGKDALDYLGIKDSAHRFVYKTYQRYRLYQFLSHCLKGQ